MASFCRHYMGDEKSKIVVRVKAEWTLRQRRVQ